MYNTRTQAVAPMESMLLQNASPPDPAHETKGYNLDGWVDSTSAMAKKMEIRVLYAPLQIPQVSLERKKSCAKTWMSNG